MGECFIVRRGNNNTTALPPALMRGYPEDVTIVERASGTATFNVRPYAVAVDDVTPVYTYQWYVDNVAVSGATSQTFTKSDLTSAATYRVYCDVSNEAGTTRSKTALLTVKSSKPTYTYTGSHELIKDHTYSWRIKLKSSGILRFTDFGYGGGLVDVFCVGGGGAGAAYVFEEGSGTSVGYGAGGGGGYTTTVTSKTLALNTDYTIVIGDGGEPQLLGVGGDGGTTTAFGVSAAGGCGAGNGKDGAKKNCYYGGDGGSGGGAGGAGSTGDSGAGGSNGGNGSNGVNGADGSVSGIGGIGQVTTTREFGETNGTLYSGGGAGARVYYSNSQNGGSGGGGNVVDGEGDDGLANTGGGGAGSGRYLLVPDADDAGKGGSGIVVIRNHR